MKPTHACLGWDMEVHLGFPDGTYLFGNADKIFYPEYWELSNEWPHDPITKIKLGYKP